MSIEVVEAETSMNDNIFISEHGTLTRVKQ